MGFIYKTQIKDKISKNFKTALNSKNKPSIEFQPDVTALVACP